MTDPVYNGVRASPSPAASGPARSSTPSRRCGRIPAKADRCPALTGRDPVGSGFVLAATSFGSEIGIAWITVTPELRSLLLRLPGVDPDRAVVTPLTRGLTNRNVRVDVPSGSFVVRLCGSHPELLGIDRRHEHAAGLAAAALGVGPEVVGWFEDAAALVTRFIEGTPVTPEAATRPDVLARIATSIAKVHAGPPIPGSFSAFACVRNYTARARLRGARLPTVLDAALERLSEIEHAVGPGPGPVPCHNDLLAANFIDDGAVIRILDWEYAAMGDPRFDLANFSANLRLGPPALAALLVAYGTRADPRAVARIRLLQTVSDLRESTWGFLQTTMSTLDVDFASYGREHLDRFRSAAAAPVFPAWLRAARG